MPKIFASRMGFAGSLGVALAGTGVAALLFVILMVIQHMSWMEFADEREFFLQHTSIIRESVVDSHRLLEEAIGKSDKDKAQTSFSEIDKAIAATGEMGKHVKPGDTEFSGILKDIAVKLDVFKQSAVLRFSLLGKDVHAEVEDRFHNDFAETMKAAEKTVTAIQSRAVASAGRIENQFRLIFPVWLIVVAGGFTAFTMLARKREKAEEAMERSLSILKATLESTADGVIAMNEKGDVVAWNRKFAGMFGMPENVLAGAGEDNVFEFVEGLLKNPHAMMAMMEREKIGNEMETEYLLELVDGRVFERKSLKRLERGVPAGKVCSFRDVTARMRHEEALKRSEESLARAQAIAHVGSWDLNIATGELSWSDEIYRIFGLQPKEFGATYDAFLSHVHPGDRERVTTAVDTANREKRRYSIEHRVARPDGSIRVVHERGETLYGPDGAPVRMIGTVQDITERKEVQDQLTLASQVFENALEGVIITDTKGTIQFANPAVFTITGYTQEEVIGQNPRILRSDRHSKEFYKEMWRSILVDGGWQGVIWNRRKDGEAFPEWLSITAVRDYTGKTTKYVSVFYDMSRIKENEESLKRQAYEDALTKLPNRLLFEDRLNSAIGSAARVGGKVGVALIGLDRLKNINETLGFPAGDQLIQKAAERLRPLVKDGDTLARFGGDEFICVLHDLKDEQDMAKMMLAMLEALSLPFSIDGHELFVTASAGAAFYPSDGADNPALVQNALVAMRRAKSQDRNSYQLYTASMNTRSYERLALENDLRKAVGREEFMVYYQPKLSILTGKITGMEALVRWNHPVHGMVSPVKFIPLAEETGLIAPIGEFVLATALAQMNKWVSHGYGSISVAVNLSAAQFRDKSLLKTIRDTLDRTGVDPSRLDVEVTESMVMGDVNATIATLTGIGNMGVKISMDDFGTGFSSLSYLKRFPIHCLKVDRSFISDIPGNEDDVAITSAIISMSHSLGLKVVAEGVETVEQLEFLRENACDEMQGYFFSPPVTAMEMTKILGSGRALYAQK